VRAYIIDSRGLQLRVLKARIEGMSVRGIARELRNEGIMISKSSVARWLKSFIDEIRSRRCAF